MKEKYYDQIDEIKALINVEDKEEMEYLIKCIQKLKKELKKEIKEMKGVKHN